jgi:acyl-coenzyme A synthetase/AMP-(fatty) acid ligase
MTAALPLLQGHATGGVFAWRAGRAVGVDEFCRDVRRVAAALPERHHVFNRCTDRYRFAVGFAAALVRRQVSLLPPNETPDLVGRLVASYPDLCCLSDAPGAPAGLETLAFPELGGGAAGASDMPAVPAEQLAAVLFTSGSTGEQKPFPRTWGSMVRSAAEELEALGLRAFPGMAVIGTVPPQHSYGLESTLLMAMQGGLALHAGRPFFPADIRSELDALPRPRSLVTTPIHLRVLLGEPDELPSVDLVLCATAPLAPQLAATAEARFGAPLHEIYGCTEAGQVATRRTVETNEWRTLPGVQLRGDSRGAWASGGHIEGEVLLADVIELRGSDRFLLHGRTSDLVNIAGKRTSLAHLNYHLNSIEGVLDGVFIVPDDDGEAVARLAAFAVAPGHTAESLMSALRLRIDPAFLPRPLCMVEALPRNDIGKLPRESLTRIVAGP